MPLKSLEVWNWHPKDKEEDYYEFESDGSRSDEYDYKPYKPTNVWDTVSFLCLTPMLQHLSIIGNYFLHNPPPIALPPKNILPVLQFLTAIECASKQSQEISRWMLELLKYSPMLKKIQCIKIMDRHSLFGRRYLDAPGFKEESLKGNIRWKKSERNVCLVMYRPLRWERGCILHCCVWP
jgi:hypothetical protein